MTAKKESRLWIIGLQAEVLESADPDLVGLSGVIVDETRNMVLMEHNGKIKKVPKHISTLLITLQNGERIKINGKKLIGRPDERVGKG
ncbi:MAG: ribonuclease P protein subunit [Candidatus Hadarchaeales archaeon]